MPFYVSTKKTKRSDSCEKLLGKDTEAYVTPYTVYCIVQYTGILYMSTDNDVPYFSCTVLMYYYIVLITREVYIPYKH